MVKRAISKVPEVVLPDTQKFIESPSLRAESWVDERDFQLESYARTAPQ